MAIFRVSEVVSATRGKLLSGPQNARLKGVSTDSRAVLPGQLFIPIVGQKHDAHQFIPEALTRGCGGILVGPGWHSPWKGKKRVSLIQVRDTTRALGDLAAFHRRRFSVPLVAVTGSSGKTTTKEMAAAVLGTRLRVLKSPGNLNNLIGLPLSLFHLGREHEAVVVEMGMNRPGEIHRLTEIARPRVGVLTNVSPVHLAHLGSVSAVREAKGEMVKVMGGRGMLVANGEDNHCLRLAKRFRTKGGKAILFGRGAKVEVQAAELKSLGKRGMAFTLRTAGETRRLRIRPLGEHNVLNALAAAAVGRAIGLPVDAIAEGLSGLKPPKGRMQVRRLANGVHWVDDAYNANPRSVKVALETFSTLRNGGRSIVILGDMLELGRRGADAHRTLGATVAAMARVPAGLPGSKKTYGVDYLLVLGDQALFIADEALRRGMGGRRIIRCDAPAKASRWLRRNLRKGDWVLVKGSRGMAMERILEGLDS